MPGNPGQQIREGFQILREYCSHDRPLRGLNVITMMTEERGREEGGRSKHYILTWDSKGIYMWDQIRIVKKIRFPKAQQNFISSISYISKIGVFFAPALDMSFKIYDNSFHLIESIHHDERAIIDCSYDREKDILILSGASGVSVWRIITNNQISSSGTFVLEKLFTIDGCEEWVSKMIHEPQYHRIYALMDTSVAVCDLRSHTVKLRLHEIHEAPVTCVCWYPVDQYYITACSKGQVSCWSPNRSHQKSSKTLPYLSHTLKTSHPQQHTLLHSFFAHSKAVTGLALHPNRSSGPGMLITAGLDGYVKVFDLEIYSPLQTISVSSGVTHFRVTQFYSNDICLFAQSNGEAAMWRINSCCSEFKICASDVVSLVGYECLVPVERFVDEPVRYHEPGEVIQIATAEEGNGEQEDNPEQEPRENHFGLVESRPSTALPPTLASLEAVIEATAVEQLNKARVRTPKVNETNENVGNGQGKPPSRKDPRKNAESNRQTAVMVSVVVSAPLNNPSPTVEPSSRPGTQTLRSNLESSQPPTLDPTSLEKCIIAFAGNDLQVISPSSQLKSRVEPDALVEGVLDYIFSVFQQLLFCLLENGHIRIFCTKSPTCVLLREVYVGAIGSDEPTALVLGDGLTKSLTRTSSTSKDMRGNPSPLNLEETLAIGTSSGTLICLDTFQECQTVAIQQIFQGKVEALKYRRNRRELLGLGYSFASPCRVIRVWKIPDMVLMFEVKCDPTFSCWEMSPSLSFICVGCRDGFSRLFNLIIDSNLRTATPSTTTLPNQFEDAVTLEDKNIATVTNEKAPKGRPVEVLRQEGGHEAEILAIAFCDELRAYATTSLDCTIKFWDYEKRVIKSILFNSPPRCALFTSPIGDILVTQGRHISTISKEIWEENGLLQIAKDGEDPWDQSWLQDDPPVPLKRGSTARVDSAKNQPKFKDGQEEHPLHVHYDTTTFLTDSNRVNMEIGQLENDFIRAMTAAGEAGADESYWTQHSSLAVKKDMGPGVILNVRKPKYKLKGKESRKRFASRIKNLEEQEAQQFMEMDSMVETDTAFETSLESEPIGDNQTNDIEDTHQNQPMDLPNGSVRPTVAKTGTSGPKRNAFLKSARAIHSTIVLTKSLRNSTIARPSQFKPSPPSQVIPSAVSSLLQHQKKIGTYSQDPHSRRESGENGGKNNPFAEEYADEYHVKPNGPSVSRASQGMRPSRGGRFYRGTQFVIPKESLTIE